MGIFACVFFGEKTSACCRMGKSVTRSSVFCHVNESVLFCLCCGALTNLLPVAPPFFFFSFPRMFCKFVPVVAVLLFFFLSFAVRHSHCGRKPLGFFVVSRTSHTTSQVVRNCCCSKQELWHFFFPHSSAALSIVHYFNAPSFFVLVVSFFFFFLSAF